VRGGVVENGQFQAKPWTPGQTVDGAVAPLTPECTPLFQVELEDMARMASMNAPPPGAALAFSPDGRWLAIGSDAGSLRIVDAETGASRVEKRIAEGAVKQVAWSADSGTLYVGEQSPDANLEAVDPATLVPRWTVRLADDLETSALPPADDVYAIYSLPGVYALRVLADGSLLVAGAHGWTTAEGPRKNRSRVYHFGPDGSRLAAWPAAGAADAVLMHPAVQGDTALIGMSRSADGPAPADLPIGGVLALDVSTLTPRWQHVFPVLAPYFNAVFVWEAIGLGDDLAFVGLGDGRAFLFDHAGNTLATLTPGVPVLSQGVPISTGVGFGTVVGSDAYFLTTGTNIPWGSADPMARPPSAHPAQETLHAVSRDGAPLWSWHGDHAVEGVVASPDGSLLAVGAAGRDSDTRTDLFGALLFDRATGSLLTSCSTVGPAWYRPTWAPDNARLAVAEAPFLADGAPHGSYRVTVFR
jgi:hypothetical protein